MRVNRRRTCDTILADLRANGPATEAAVGRRLGMDPSNVRACCTVMARAGEVRIARDGIVTAIDDEES